MFVLKKQLLPIYDSLKVSDPDDISFDPALAS